MVSRIVVLSSACPLQEEEAGLCHVGPAAFCPDGGFGLVAHFPLISMLEAAPFRVDERLGRNLHKILTR